MIQLNSKNLFRLLGIFTMGSVYLPIVFNNVPSPFHTPTFYLIAWLILVAFLQTKILFSKGLLLVYFFIVVYLLFSGLSWSERTTDLGDPINLMWIYKEIVWPFLGILMSTYFVNRADYFGFGLVTFFSLIFIAITSISSIAGLETYTDAVRMISLDETARKLGIGNYGFFLGTVILTPVITSYIRNKKLQPSYRIVFGFFMMIILYSTLQSQFTTFLITAVLFLLLSFFFNIKNFWRLSMSLIVFFALVFLIFNEETSRGISYLANLIPGATLEARLSDMALAIKLTDYDPTTSTTYLSGERLYRSYFSFQSFLENPVTGGGDSSGHAFWLDRLALFGIIGFFPWILIFRNQILQNYRQFNETFKPYYLLSIFSLIFVGLIKGGLNSPQLMVSVFFLLPGMFFLQFVIHHKKEVAN